MGPKGVSQFEEINDGTGATLLMGEVNDGLRAWGDPINWRDPAEGFASTPRTFSGPERSGNTVMSFADGNARLMNNDIDPQVLKALATPNGQD